MKFWHVLLAVCPVSIAVIVFGSQSLETNIWLAPAAFLSFIFSSIAKCLAEDAAEGTTTTRDAIIVLLVYKYFSFMLGPKDPK